MGRKKEYDVSLRILGLAGILVSEEKCEDVALPTKMRAVISVYRKDKLLGTSSQSIRLKKVGESAASSVPEGVSRHVGIWTGMEHTNHGLISFQSNLKPAKNGNKNYKDFELVVSLVKEGDQGAIPIGASVFSLSSAHEGPPGLFDIPVAPLKNVKEYPLISVDSDSSHDEMRRCFFNKKQTKKSGQPVKASVRRALDAAYYIDRDDALVRLELNVSESGKIAPAEAKTAPSSPKKIHDKDPEQSPEKDVDMTMDMAESEEEEEGLDVPEETPLCDDSVASVKTDIDETKQMETLISTPDASEEGRIKAVFAENEDQSFIDQPKDTETTNNVDTEGLEPPAVLRITADESGLFEDKEVPAPKLSKYSRRKQKSKKPFYMGILTCQGPVLPEEKAEKKPDSGKLPTETSRVLSLTMDSFCRHPLDTTKIFCQEASDARDQMYQEAKFSCGAGDDPETEERKQKLQEKKEKSLGEFDKSWASNSLRSGRNTLETSTDTFKDDDSGIQADDSFHGDQTFDQNESFDYTLQSKESHQGTEDLPHDGSVDSSVEHTLESKESFDATLEESLYQSSRVASRRNKSSSRHSRREGSSSKTDESPRGVDDFPESPTVADRKVRTVSEMVLDILTCRAYGDETLDEKDDLATIPSFLLTNDDTTVDDLTLTSHEQRINRKRIHRRRSVDSRDSQSDNSTKDDESKSTGLLYEAIPVKSGPSGISSYSIEMTFEESLLSAENEMSRFETLAELSDRKPHKPYVRRYV